MKIKVEKKKYEELNKLGNLGFNHQNLWENREN
jgi:hypothetical protein